MEHYEAGNETACDHIGKGIELEAELAGNVEESGKKTIEEIKENPKGNKQKGHLKLLIESENGRDTAAKKVEQGDAVWDMGFDVHLDNF